jgi:hypothetical protein
MGRECRDRGCQRWFECISPNCRRIRRRIWAICVRIGLHLLEAKERVVILDVRWIGGSEGVEFEHGRARGRCDTEDGGGKREGKEDAWGLI